MGLPYTCVQLGHIVKCLDELGSRWVWICQSENDEVTTTQGYSFFHSCEWLICCLPWKFVTFVTHVIIYLFVLWHLCRDKTGVVSAAEICIERLGENGSSEAQAANKKWNSDSSAEEPMSCGQDLAKYQIPGVGSAPAGSTTAQQSDQ